MIISKKDNHLHRKYDLFVQTMIYSNLINYFLRKYDFVNQQYEKWKEIQSLAHSGGTGSIHVQIYTRVDLSIKSTKQGVDFLCCCWLERCSSRSGNPDSADTDVNSRAWICLVVVGWNVAAARVLILIKPTLMSTEKRMELYCCCGL